MGRDTEKVDKYALDPFSGIQIKEQAERFTGHQALHSVLFGVGPNHIGIPGLVTIIHHQPTHRGATENLNGATAVWAH